MYLSVSHESIQNDYWILCNVEKNLQFVIFFLLHKFVVFVTQISPISIIDLLFDNLINLLMDFTLLECTTEMEFRKWHNVVVIIYYFTLYHANLQRLSLIAFPFLHANQLFAEHILVLKTLQHQIHVQFKKSSNPISSSLPMRVSKPQYSLRRPGNRLNCDRMF